LADPSRAFEVVPAPALQGIPEVKRNRTETHWKLSLEPRHFEQWLALFADIARQMLPAVHAAMLIGKSRRTGETFQQAKASQRSGLGLMSA
jgi:truncated hemoglobin YjbI